MIEHREYEEGRAPETKPVPAWFCLGCVLYVALACYALWLLVI